MVSPPRLLLMKTTTLLLLSAAFALPVAAQTPAASPTADYLALSREALNKFYDLRKLLGKEQAEWKLGREVLKSRVELLENQLKELENKTAEENKTITGSDTEREQLDKKAKDLLAVQDSQVGNVEKLEARVRKLWPLLPLTLQSKLQGQYDGLPAPGMKKEDIKATSADRFLKVLAILNEVNKFHGDIQLVNERRKLKDGREVEVRTLYFGLGIAYYAGSEETASVAGIGTPGPDGWQWKETPEIASQIDLLIGMNKGDKVAGFVPLPVEIR
jgi:hypothetical protein